MLVSKKLIYKIKQKKILHQNYKKRKTQPHYAVFSSLRSECIKMSTTCYVSYLGKVENYLKIDLNKFWSFVKNKRRNDVDMVDHEILLGKVNSYGVRSRALDWLRSYLSDRRLQVRANCHLSNEFDVTSGVPQGSHLGPVLFSIFINDIGVKLKSEYLLYADDMKLFRAVGDNHDMEALQEDISELEEWCTKN